MNLKELILFRKELHRNPEVSMDETNTSQFIKETFQRLNPAKITDGIAGTGLVVEFDTGRPGKKVMFRSELDALPIQEKNDSDYASNNPGVSHACGHDGHMAILYALARRFLEYSPEKLCGKLQLLFQPGEETACGARLVADEKKFYELEPDYIFALHNLPGFPINTLILKPGTFAAASVGVKIRYTGETSHAGHPENGNSPVIPIVRLTEKLNHLVDESEDLKDYALITIIHIKVGEIAFGTSPGSGVLMATLRSYLDKDLELMKKKVAGIAEKEAAENNLDFELEWVEEFPAIVNNDECFNYLNKAGKKLGMEFEIRKKPFSWTEDFSYFLQKYKGCFFGLGSGLTHPQLHNSNYDFPDELIETGSKIFFEIFKQINSE